MLASKPKNTDGPKQTGLWNWLVAALIRIEPNSDLLDDALKMALVILKKQTKPRTSQKQRAAGWLERRRDPDGFARRKAIEQIMLNAEDA